MKVTVKDCLELSTFKGARVVAGEAGMENDVKSVSVLKRRCLMRYRHTPMTGASCF